MKEKIYKREIEIPEGIEVSLDNFIFSVKNKEKNVEVKKKLFDKTIKMEIKDNKVIFSAEKASRKQKRIINTFSAHIKNMIKGVIEPCVYKLKICASHFPMNVSVKDGVFIVENFLGEKTPRKLKLKEGVEVKIEGDAVIVESPDKELAGQVAADIETLTKRTRYDKRIFQDGIYIFFKDGKEI